jgi:hypothetical protein
MIACCVRMISRTRWLSSPACGGQLAAGSRFMPPVLGLVIDMVNHNLERARWTGSSTPASRRATPNSDATNLQAVMARAPAWPVNSRRGGRPLGDHAPRGLKRSRSSIVRAAQSGVGLLGEYSLEIFHHTLTDHCLEQTGGLHPDDDGTS